MGRGKRDNFSQPPVDHYRRQIGKQDYKKVRSELKETKKKSQAKKSSPKTYRDSFLLVMTLTVVILAVYLILYMFMNKEGVSLW